MVCEVKVNAINTLRKAEAIDDTRKIINDVLFEKANRALTQFAIDRYGLETNGQMLFDVTSRKLVDERTSTYRRDTIINIERAEPNERLFEQLQVLKTNYDNAKAIAEQSIMPASPKSDDGKLYGVANKTDLFFTDETLNKINSFVDAIGVGFNFVDFGQDNVLAAANFIDKTIDIINDVNKRPDAWNKLPEEAAHWWYRLLKTDSELKKLLWESEETIKKRNYLFNETDYGKLENVNSPEDLTEEAVGQVIAETIHRLTNNKGTAKDKSLWDKLLNFINSIISKFKKAEAKNEETPFTIAAAKILSSDISDLLTLEQYDELYTQASPEIFENNIEEIIKQELGEDTSVQIEPDYFDYLINKKYKRKSKYLAKTIAKTKQTTKSPVRELPEDLNDWRGKPKLVSHIDSLELSSKIKFLEKYKKPIALNSNINVDGAKKEEITLYNEVREKIKAENPNLKSIEPVEFMTEVENWFNAKYNMSIKKIATDGFQNYRGSLISKNENLKHYRLGQYFHNEYATGGHFEYTPFAWITLTPFANGKKMLIHEAQSDFIERIDEVLEANESQSKSAIATLLSKNDRYATVLLESIKKDKEFSKTVFDEFKHTLDELRDRANAAESIDILNSKYDSTVRQSKIDNAYAFLWSVKNTIKNNPEVWEKVAEIYFSEIKRKTRYPASFKQDVARKALKPLYDLLVQEYGKEVDVNGNLKIDAELERVLEKNFFKYSFNKNHFLSELKKGSRGTSTIKSYINDQITSLKEARLNHLKERNFYKTFLEMDKLSYDQVNKIYDNLKYNFDLLKKSGEVSESTDAKEIGLKQFNFYNEVSSVYRTPLMHSAILTAKPKYSEIYFAGGRATILTQGNWITAELYAGPEEVAKISDEEKLAIYKEAATEVKKDYGLYGDNPNSIVNKILNAKTYAEAKKIKGDYVRGSVGNTVELGGNPDSFYAKVYKLAGDKFLEVGPMYTSFSKLKGVKLKYTVVDDLIGETPAYAVDLSNYNFTSPVLFGLNTSTKNNTSRTEQRTNTAVPFVSVNLNTINDSVSKEVGEVLAKTLAAKMKIDFHTVTPEEAQQILQNSSKPYMGEPAFYFAGAIYFVGDNVNISTVLHEFSHPMIQGIRRSNPALFESLYQELSATPEGQAIIAHVKKLYPELGEDTPLFKEEVLVYALQLNASNKINEQIESEGYKTLIDKLLAALKQFLRGIFGNAVNIKNLSSTTTISDLANMLLSDEEIDLDATINDVTEEDLVMYYKEVVERAKDLLDNSSPEAVQAIVNQTFLDTKATLNQIREFNTGKDSVNKQMLQKAMLKEGTTELLPAVSRSLKGFQDVLPSNNLTAEAVIENAVNAEEKLQELALIKATALVNSIDRIKSSSINTLNELSVIDQNSTLLNNRNVVALLTLYKSTANSWINLVDEINTILEEYPIGTDSLFYQTINEVLNNSKKIVKKVGEIYKKNNVQFFVEITGYMTKFVEEQLNSNLKTALKKLPLDEQEALVDDLYNKIVQGNISEQDLQNLYEKGVPRDVINRFIDQYNTYVINEKKIGDILSGKTKDVSWFNRWLESYSSSNDPVVGSLAMYIQNEKTDVENEVWNKSQIFRSALSKLLPQVNFSKLNDLQIRDMVSGKDTIFYIDKQTGKPVPKEVWTFLNEFGNGWRYEQDRLEYEYALAKDSGDKNKAAEALDRLRQFNKAYMWQEFVPEFYEKDDIFSQSDMGKRAYLAKKTAFDNFINLQNQFEKELERFENYSTIEEAFKTYQRLYSLYYEDGTEKVDDPANDNYDRSIAELLIEHRNATSDFYEWVPIPNSLSTAYNEFVTELEAKNIKRTDPRFQTELKKWEKQNIKIKYSDEFYEERSVLLGRLAEIQENMRTNMNLSFDISSAYKTISDLIYTYRDEYGQPDANQLGKDRLRKIKDLEQDIINFRSKFDMRTGLSKEDSTMLTLLLEKSKVERLSVSDSVTLSNLIQKQKDAGIDVVLVEEMLDIFSSLSDLSSKVPTEYYLDALNMHISKYNLAEVTETTVDDFINSTEFFELVEKDDALRMWFNLNHVTVIRYEKNKEVEKFQRSSANSVLRPTDGKYFETTKIIDNETGEEIELLGVPNARHSRREVKNKYRTIPRGTKREDFVGKYVNNKGEFLPRSFEPGNKYSALDDRFIDKRYQALKANPNSPEFRLLELIKEHHLEMQKNGSNYGKLYLDVPRYATRSGDFYQAFQKGEYGQKFKNINSNVKEWLKQKFGKSTQDYLNDLNYDPDNNLVNTDVNGDEVSYIPVTGIFNIDADLVDADIFNSIFRYGLSLQTQKQLYSSLPLVQSIISTLEDPKNQPKNLKKKSKQLQDAKTKVREFANLKTSTYNRLEQVRSLVEREYFGRKVSDMEEANPRLTKWLSNLTKWSSRSSLLMNIPSDLKNQFSGYVQTIIESTGGRFITNRDLALSATWASKAMIDWTTNGIYTTGPANLSTQLVQIFDPNFKTTDQYGNTVYRSMFKDLMNFEWTYMHRKFGEMDVAMRLFGAFLHGQKIDQILANGEKTTIRYVDAWEQDENGVARLKAGIHPGWSNMSVYHNYRKGETLEQIAKKYNITVEELKAKNRIKSDIQLADGQEIIISKSEYYKLFKNRLQGTSRALFGVYDDFGQPEGNKLLLYRMFFFMRKWFTPMFVNRFGMDTSKENFGGARYDWALGKTTKGFYVSALQVIYRGIKSKGVEFQFMNDEEKADMQRFLAEGLVVVVTSLIASMVFGYEDDDEDKWKKIRARSGAYGTDEFNTYGFLTNHALLLLLGVQAESSAFIPIPKVAGINFGADDYAKLLTSTSTAFSNTVLTYMEILSDILNFLTMNDAGKYKRDTGPYWFQKEGEYKIIKRALNLIGFSGGTGDPETLLKNLSKSGGRIR